MELLQHEVEPGWLYLSADVSLLGLTGICNRALGQWTGASADFLIPVSTYENTASGADDCAGGGCARLLYPVKRKREISGTVGGSQ